MRPTDALSWVVRWTHPDGTGDLMIVSESRLDVALSVVRAAGARDLSWERASSLPPTSTSSDPQELSECHEQAGG